MLSEKAMEDQIAEAPEQFLGETGLSLFGRQVRIGQYIFDLVFEDRHGGKLIVELQKGTLDRSHMYKLLDYYDAYKERNPADFVEAMVVANVIPAERKRRLHDRGIEFREVPESRFSIKAVPEMSTDSHQQTLTASGIAEKTQPPIEQVTGNPPQLTPEMRSVASTRAYDHFGFSGIRAAIACLYARPEGATQAEVNEAARLLGSRQSGYYNMLRKAQDWNHEVLVWDDLRRGGKVFKLSYNPSNSAPRADHPPADWRELNRPKTPARVNATVYPQRAGRR